METNGLKRALCVIDLEEATFLPQGKRDLPHMIPILDLWSWPSVEARDVVKGKCVSFDGIG